MIRYLNYLAYNFIILDRKKLLNLVNLVSMVLNKCKKRLILPEGLQG